MKWIAMVQTRDGELHDNALKADRHAQKVYGEALSRMATRLLAVEKYTAMHEFLEANLPVFLELHALRADMEMEKTDIFGE